MFLTAETDHALDLDTAHARHAALADAGIARLLQIAGPPPWPLPVIVALRHWQCRDLAPDLPDAVAADQPVLAVLAQSRWVAQCPDCAGAQLAARTDRRLLCSGCGNVIAGRRWRPVVWPDDTDAIEQVLAVRPLAHNRNWHPGETVADLVAENAAHGLPSGLLPPSGVG